MSGSRPQSASNEGPIVSRSSRPGSAVAKIAVDENVLNQLAEEIRTISKQIKLLHRKKQLGINLESPEEDEEDEGDVEIENKDLKVDPDLPKLKVDPIVVLEEDRRQLMTKYEQLNNNTPYQGSSQDAVKEFCDLYFWEFDSSTERHAKFLMKYYDPNPTLNIVGYGVYEGREAIVNMSLVSAHYAMCCIIVCYVVMSRRSTKAWSQCTASLPSTSTPSPAEACSLLLKSI